MQPLLGEGFSSEHFAIAISLNKVHRSERPLLELSNGCEQLVEIALVHAVGQQLTPPRQCEK